MRGHLPTRLIALAGSAVLALASAAPAMAAPPVGVAAGPAASSWIVTLAPGRAAPQLAAGLTRNVGGEVGLVYTRAINGFQFNGSAGGRRGPATEPECGIRHARQPDRADRETPADRDRADRGVRRQTRRRRTPTTTAIGATVRAIAILDTGIDLDHPDLAASIDQGDSKNCVTPGAPAEDGYGHGTHVAGTAAAPREQHRCGRRGSRSRTRRGQGLRRFGQLERVARPVRLRPRDVPELGRGQLERHRRHEHELRRAARVGRLPDRSAARRRLLRPCSRNHHGGGGRQLGRQRGQLRPGRVPRSHQRVGPDGLRHQARRAGRLQVRPGDLLLRVRRHAGGVQQLRGVSRCGGARRRRVLDVAERDLQDEQRDEHGDSARRRCGRADGRRGARAHASPGDGESPAHRANVRTARSQEPMRAAQVRERGRTTPMGSRSR